MPVLETLLMTNQGKVSNSIDHAHLDFSEAHHERLGHIKWIISRWLTSSSSFALWVSDMNQLNKLVDALQASYSELLDYVENAREANSVSDVEVDAMVSHLYKAAVEFDQFLRMEIIRS